ncbi:MAG TPA: sulfatase-like hydrolase/transferase [Phycisphaerae bacterium]|nr:sulfatase-like hydrolase/transferase [Phycisphaerae bacterium]
MPGQNAQVEAKPRSRGGLLGIAVLVVGLATAGVLICARGRAALPITPRQVVAPGAAAGFNVLLVTMDTTRRDRLGCYGYKQAVTPTIDSLAARGIRFDDAVSSSPLTLPSHTTMLTGLYPVNHGARHNGSSRLTEEHVTLAEVLKARGYQTAAFVSSVVLEQRYGLAQGFELYDFEVAAEGFRAHLLDMNERPADVVTDAALDWLGRRQEAGTAAPFFAWVHYFDPHHPYQPPTAHLVQFPTQPYDGEIAFVDSQLKRLLEALSGHGLRDRTLIALVADHGEALGEHLEETHGYYIYDSTIRVGFVLSCPALFDRAYCVNDRVVGLVDLKPTIEDLLGIAPNVPCDGQSLLADISADRAVYVETKAPLSLAGWSPLYALRRHTDKYILAPQPEYYDLEADPQESRNLYAERPAPLDALERQLTSFRDRWDGDSAERAAARVMSAEEVERLRALGYVHSDSPPPSGPLPDPKEMMPVYLKMERAIDLLDQDRLQEALQLAKAALEECDSYPLGERTLASIYFRLGRLNEAIDVLRRSAQRRPEFATYISLGRMYLHQQRFQDAKRAIALAEDIYPDDGRVFTLRGDLLRLQNRFDEAIAQYEKAIQVDPHRAGIQARERIDQLRSAPGRKNPP